jgi:hypothetical protein
MFMEMEWMDLRRNENRVWMNSGKILLVKRFVRVGKGLGDRKKNFREEMEIFDQSRSERECKRNGERKGYGSDHLSMEVIAEEDLG